MDAVAGSSLISPAVAIFIILVLWHLRSVTQWRARSRGLPFPPGPRALPVVGNLFNMPTRHAWIAYRDLCAEFGDIIHFRTFGQSIVVLGSAKVIFEYLDKRAANTSDRITPPLARLIEQDETLGFLPYGKGWRDHRRAFWQLFNRAASVDYQDAQRTAAHMFLDKLLDQPARLKQLIRFSFAATILKVVYDIDIVDEDDEFVRIAEASIEGAVQGLIPGKFLVDLVPLLRYIQPWIPGAESPKLWTKWARAARRLKEVPYSVCKARMAQGEASQSVVARLLSRFARHEDALTEEGSEALVKNIGMIAYEAGIDTVFASLQGVFLALSLYPEALRKAHAELDAVVGPHRLPDFCDQDSLVYVNAIIREAMRWHVVLPMGSPHATTEDDELNGYFIPAGTLLQPATWACMHDPDVFDSPEEFRPERFIRDGKLDPGARDPISFIFGICPGRHFAVAALFINVASVLHVFDIGPPVGEDGKPIKVQYKMTDGFSSYPEDLRCTVGPRSAAAAALIRSSVAEARVEVDE